jgi:FkbM family methyltransferase
MNLIDIIKKSIDFIWRRYSPRGAYISFSPTGEDLLIKQATKKLGIETPSYIDIGCHHPIFGNTTYLLYRGGSSGIVVEPNDVICQKISEIRARDICVNAGISDHNGKETFYTFERGTRNTFSKSQAIEWKKQSGQEYQEKLIDVISLNTLIKKSKNSCPDIISIDTEGYEEKILSGFDWKIRPKIFCIESAGRKESLISLFSNKGYTVFADTPANTIFIDKK